MNAHDYNILICKQFGMADQNSHPEKRVCDGLLSLSHRIEPDACFD